MQSGAGWDAVPYQQPELAIAWLMLHAAHSSINLRGRLGAASSAAFHQHKGRCGRSVDHPCRSSLHLSFVPLHTVKFHAERHTHQLWHLTTPGPCSETVTLRLIPRRKKKVYASPSTVIWKVCRAFSHEENAVVLE